MRGQEAVAREISEMFYAATPIIYLVTQEEERAVAILRAVAKVLRAGMCVWSVHRGLLPLCPEARDPKALMESLAHTKERSLAVLLDFHEALRGPNVVRLVRDMIPSFVEKGVHLAIVAPRLELPDGLEGDTTVIQLPLPDREELNALLASLTSTPGEMTDAQHRAVMAARGLTVRQARRAFLRALRADADFGRTALSRIHAEKRHIFAQNLSMEYVECSELLDNIGGLESFKAWVSERAQAFRHDARDFGLAEPKGVMLLGVQGCGKSLSAKCVAGEFGVPLLRLELGRLIGTGNGSAEERLARALSAAEAIAPVVLWADEIEKAFAGSAPGQGGDSVASRLLGVFSTWLQERQGSVFVVATANDVTKLPPELLRRGRFDELFFVDLPDRDARRAILSFHLRKRGRLPEKFNLDALADQCPNYSGAELEQVVISALHRAFSQQRDVDSSDLSRAARDIVPLSTTYEEQIKALREWAWGRTRLAGRETAIVDLFRTSTTTS